MNALKKIGGHESIKHLSWLAEVSWKADEGAVLADTHVTHSLVKKKVD